MRYQGALIVVEDMKKSRKFYEEILKQKVENDFGSNVSFEGGFCLQTKESWIDFIGRKKEEVIYQNYAAELYFEEENMDDFLAKLNKIENLQYVHSVKEHRWGQRAIRILDPDYHVIEIAEEIGQVCKRFVKEGLSVEQVAKRMDCSIEFVKQQIEQ